MKQSLLLFALTFSLLASAQQRVNQCGIIIPPKSARSNFSSVYEAGDYIRTMLGHINWQENFQIQEQNGINNAYAAIIRNQRYIVYDNNFLENLDAYSGTKWASISVLAHEMGHHYRNHVVDRQGSTPPKELEADYFSGYVMAKMGASQAEALAAMEKIAATRGSASHPARADRLSAIAQGWNAASGTANTPPPNNPTQPQTPQQGAPPTGVDASWIYLSLYANSNMTVYLSDDGRTYNEAPLKVGEPFVFKFEVYNYGWLRFGNDSRARTYRLQHGKDYAIVWSRRSNAWTVVEVP
ncbi:M48 family metalloprotease [Flavisolibacter sp. BT320]|nr:M48 family metalloprotease [Flavisolibacter longurius]